VNRPSWLDQFVRRFQDRWETNPQYRSLVSGLVGLVLVLTLCTCTGLLTVAGNNVLASVGLTNNNSNSGIDSNTGTNNVQKAQSFPTATFGPFTNQPTPVGGTVLTSQTPPPAGTDTPVPTDTPIQTCAPNCGGGGGGGGGGGSGGTITASQSPTPWVAGQTGSLIFHSSAPNVGIALIYHLPGCVTDTVEPAGQTDGSGNATISYQLQSCLQTGEGNVTIFANFSGTTVTTSVNVACQV
jgi:hypothetical protein